MKKYLIKYSSIIAFIVFFILIEFWGTYLTEGVFYIKDLRYILSLIFIFSTILYLIKSETIRFYVVIGILGVQGIINLGFVLLYEMTSQQFDYSMFNLRSDAMGIMENIPLNFFTAFFFFLVISLIFVFGRRLVVAIKEKNIKEPFSIKPKVVICLLLFFIGFSGNILTAHSILSTTDEDPYQLMLTGTTASSYKQYGITSNFINEMYSGLVYNSKDELPITEVESFIYQNVNEPSKYFGVSEGNNVVTILGETLEWFGFISNTDIYPNGMKLPESQIRELFPNFYEFYDNGIILDNYYAKEKTDVSEMYSMMGSYPKDTYINYDHNTNTMPYSFANVFETIEDVTYKNTFHNGIYTFYNRNQLHENIGFNKYYASEQLEELYPDIFTDYLLSGERNLDSELFNAGKDLMFPTDERFYTYTLSVTMHGRFDKRENLDNLGYYDKLRQYGIDIDDPTLTENEFIFTNYLATALDFDAALGYMFDDLKQKNLLENTTIVLFSDHYAYYQGLSAYVKDEYYASTSMANGTNYLELYRVPALIYDTKLVNAVDNNNESRVINKFASSCDIVPTLYDILGINYYTNMYYGNSIFSNAESLIYSRSYDVFFNDKVYFKNFNNIEFYNTDYFKTVEELEQYIEFDLYPRANTLVNKIKYMDQVYYFDIYSNKTLYNNYIERIKLKNT